MQDQDPEVEAMVEVGCILEENSAPSSDMPVMDEDISLPSTSTSSTSKRRRQAENMEDPCQTEKLELLKKLCSRYEQPPPKLDNVDKFFVSISDTVKQFPKEEIAKLKLKISQLVGEVKFVWQRRRQKKCLMKPHKNS